MDPSLLLNVLIIFVLRMVDIVFYTMRVMMVVRGRRWQAWVFALLQALGYILTMRIVFLNLENIYYLIAYIVGFATGLVVGMAIEDHLSLGITHIRIISPLCGPELLDHLRTAGYAATEVPALGREGCVTYLNCIVLRRDIDEVTQLVAEVDDNAFITAGNIRLLWHGFLHRSPKMKRALFPIKR